MTPNMLKVQLKALALFTFVVVVVWFLIYSYIDDNRTKKWNFVNSNKLTGSIDRKLLKENKSIPSALPFIPKRNCSLWNYPEEWKKTKKPQIVLDPGKFLYPGLVFGPNNQIIGLKQSIYLAIRLNRTLVIPRFRSHYSIKQMMLSAYEVIDVERLCRFISCLSIEQLRKKCGGSFDVAFQAMTSKVQQIQTFESQTGMNILKINKTLLYNISGSTSLRLEEKGISANIPSLPSADVSITYAPWISADSDAIQKTFRTSAPCAVFASVFGQIKLRTYKGVALPLTSPVNDVASIGNDVMYSAVTDSVRHPPCVIEAAASYVREVLGGLDYVGVHWRFNKDWKSRCRKNLDRFKEICDDLSKIQPVDVAAGIASTMSDYLNKTNKMRSLTIYIATPPSENKFKNETYFELNKINNKFNPPSSSLGDYLSTNYGACWEEADWANVDAITSLVEMEIIMQSSWYFYADVSSWTTNIRPFRIQHLKKGSFQEKPKFSIVAVAKKELNHKLNQQIN